MKIWKNFDYSQSKYLEKKWTSKDEFFDWYNNIKTKDEKKAAFSQIKALFIINYRKEFKYKVVFSLKNYLFWFCLISFIFSFLELFLLVVGIIISFISNTQVLVEVFAFSAFLFLNLFISYLPIFINISFWKKINKKEFFYIYGKGLKNPKFNFSNKKEIFDFIKNKNYSERIFFSWSEKDFLFFNILYSREIENKIIKCLQTSLISEFSNLKKSAIYSSITTPILFHSFMNDEIDLRKYTLKEGNFQRELTSQRILVGTSIKFPIRIFQKTKKRKNVIIFFILFKFFFYLMIYALTIGAIIYSYYT